jgi:signal transduction histidine kinase
VDRAILALQPPETIAGAVLRHMGALLPWRGAAVVTFDVDGGEARLLAVFGDPGCELPAVRPLRAEERGLAPADTRVPKPGSPLLDLPLAVHGVSIGVLLVHQHQGARPLPASELELVRQVADRLAVALHNWTLFEREADARRRLEAVSTRLVDVQETERRLLARELHDEVGQSLTALKLQLELAAHRAEPASLERAGAVVNDLIEQVRNLSLDLRPAILDDFGLLPALLWHVERYGRLTGVRVRLEHHGLDVRFPQAIETAAYRIVQEALTNVARHARVQEVRVAVRASADDIGIEIEDCGEGFEPARPAPQPSTGLSGMRERATMLGGDVKVVSAPGQGTLIRASFPLERPAGHAADAVRLT